MRKFQILLIAGGIVALIGVSFLLGAFDSGPVGETFDIPAGEGWYYYYEIDLPAGGQVSGSFTETSGRPVNVYVFNEAQYMLFTFRPRYLLIDEMELIDNVRDYAVL